jgi:cysteinyl-tRNA synthetase
VIVLFNSRTREKEPFDPPDRRRVQLYVCGVTVYDDCHLGHARLLVVFDMVVRYLRYRGYGVRYVRNITDIDDKIIRRAQETGESVASLTKRMIGRFHEDQAGLGVHRPDEEPCATEYLPAMIALIETLVERGFAYPAPNGDVYYRVERFPAYGALSGRRLDELRVGSRVEVEEAKRDPLDFALWKAAKPGEPAWASPWGRGRPGWHIECSAMATTLLKTPIDIHGGGQDLEFPHHENEIAQSEAACGAPFVRCWIHNGLVQVGAEKMAKSLGNFLPIREALGRFDRETLRFWLLGSHYRSPLFFSDALLAQSRTGLERLYLALRGLGDAPNESDCEEIHPWLGRFEAAMDDDFNTPEALSVLFEMAREINRVRDRKPAAAAALGVGLRRLGGILGLLEHDPDAFLRRTGPDADTAWIEQRIEERRKARLTRNFAEADRIRDELAGHGILIEDGPEGRTLWRRDRQ